MANPLRFSARSRRNHGLWVIDCQGNVIHHRILGGILIACDFQESPRWLASKGRTVEAIANLAYLRRDDIHSEAIRREYAEIETQIAEEKDARQGLGLKEAFFGKGNFIRFVIAFVIFLLQQWSGQNSVGYYAPQIFTSVTIPFFNNALLSSLVWLWTDRIHWSHKLPARFRDLWCC